MNRRSLVIAAAVIGLGLVLGYAWYRSIPDPSSVAVPQQTYPWQIDILPGGGSRVLGLELGHTPLAEARWRFGVDPKLALFVSDAGPASLEAYFDRVSLGGLSAKMVLGLAADSRTLEDYAARGRKRQRAPTGGWRMGLSAEDAAAAEYLPVATITYIPAVNLDPQTVRNHFGPPAERIETETGQVHWLYPRLGLDLAVDSKGKELLQYVRPEDFGRLRGPLLRAGPTADSSSVGAP
jgi:hypothetical protein